MPFVKKNHSKDSQTSTDARNLFSGRTGELLFFVHNVLKPEDPTHNIISISGQGGVGKSTLLTRFIDEAHSTDFKDYCLTAMVDERQTTPASMMEKIADQLHMKGQLEKALKQYKEVSRLLPTEWETIQDSLLQRVPDFAGAVVEGIPIAGPLLRESAKVATTHLLGERHTSQIRRDAGRLDNPIEDLTRAFVAELNQLADTTITLSSPRTKRRRVILFFDTFEQLATEVVPWLLDCFLAAEIRNTVVLVMAGRDPIEQSIPNDVKRWLPYIESSVIYSITLNSFNEHETRAYLGERGITEPEHIDTIWKLSLGLPLYLGLLTSSTYGKVDPTKDVVDNFLRWIPEQEHVKRQLALDAALFSRPFNQDDLASLRYLPEEEYQSFYHWLIGQPFVRPQDGRYSYHEMARDLFSRHLYLRSKKGYYATRRALASHYEQLLSEIQIEEGKDASRSAEWLELVLALAQQLFLLPDKASHIRATEHVLTAHYYTNAEQRSEIVKLLRELPSRELSYQATSVRPTIRPLLHYLETKNLYNQEFLTAANNLLEKVVHEPLFSAEVLSRIYHSRGWAYKKLNEYQRAIADFDRVLELNPKYVYAYISKGEVYFSMKKHHEAIANLERALELNPHLESALELNPDVNPDDENASHILGLVYRKLNDLQRATASFERALELNPNSALIYCRRGWTYWLFKEYQRATADFDRALELDPNYVEAYRNRGWTYALLHEDRLAIADFDRVLELDPNFIPAYSGRGQAYTHLKEYQQAIADFNHILELDPNSALAYHNLGWLYMNRKEYQQAIKHFDRTIELDPEYDWAYVSRGLAYLWLKDTKQAKFNFASCWELDLDVIAGGMGKWAGVNNGWMAEWAGMCQERPTPGIAERLETIAATNPKHYVAYVCRGVALWLQGKYGEEALVELEQAIKRAPEEWDPYFWKGAVCVSLGRDEEGIAAVEKALELNLPPVLLAPLRWFEQDGPDFYQEYAVPLLARFE